LGVWNSHLARVGAEILDERLRLVADLRPYLGDAYATVARGASRDAAEAEYKPSFALPTDASDRGALTEALLAAVAERQNDELDRGVSLVGPHRDDLVLTLGAGDDGTRLPVRGYASHGESGRSRSRSGWRPTTCCAPTATTRSWSSTTCSPSSTSSVAPSWPSWSPAPSRCW
jgi:recombinational DNA repair ATPase RecF